MSLTTEIAASLRRRGTVRALARVAATVLIGIVVLGAMPEPAVAQFWNNLFGGGQPRQPPRLIPQGQPQRGPQVQQPYNPFSSLFGTGPELKKQQAPKDFSLAPPPARRSPESIASITSPVLVLGDAMADWLAYGLEDAFSERPEFGIVRRHRTYAGLIRYDTRRDVEWPQIVREAISAEKPKFIVMMVGFHDRQPIRPPAPPPGRGGAQQPAAASSPAADQDPDSPESRARASADAQNAEMRKAQSAPAANSAQAPARAAPPSGPMEFQSEAWQVAYVQKIDATIAALKSANVPVLWVGLPPQRIARQSADAVYLNELFRTRAERAGIVYVDIWDGFVDEAGRYVVQGPDFEGQTRRLRSGDGLYFTLAGARKLAHFVEREILRSLLAAPTPVALPAPEPAVQQPGRPGTTRPLAGPVIPLTVTMGGGNELLGGAPTRTGGIDPLATRVLVRGEPVTAPAGRADNFVWPRSGSGDTIKEPEPEADAPQAQSETAPQVATQTPPQQAPAPVQGAPQAAPPRPPLRTSIQTPTVPQPKAAPQPKPAQPAVTTTAPRPKAPPPPQAADGKQPAQRKAPPPQPPRASNDNAPRPPMSIAR